MRSFAVDRPDEALKRVEDHTPVSCPALQVLEVVLQLDLVMSTVDYSVQQTIIRKQSAPSGVADLRR